MYDACVYSRVEMERFSCVSFAYKSLQLPHGLSEGKKATSSPQYAFHYLVCLFSSCVCIKRIALPVFRS